MEEVRALRLHISQLKVQISTITKGVSPSKIEVASQEKKYFLPERKKNIIYIF